MPIIRAQVLSKQKVVLRDGVDGEVVSVMTADLANTHKK